MEMNPYLLTIRAKKLGVLIRDARLANEKSTTEIARAIGVTDEDFESYEMGQRSPSLPELEVLAYHLDVPLDHFWGNKSISEDNPRDKPLDLEQLVELRQRIIGTKLRLARQDANLSLPELANMVGLSAELLEAYELGNEPVELPVLEAVCRILNLPIQDFVDRYGPVGEWDHQQRFIRDFLLLPADMQAFVSKPVNRPYLELAQRLSEMSVDKLRAVGEGILDITL